MSAWTGHAWNCHKEILTTAVPQKTCPDLGGKAQTQGLSSGGPALPSAPPRLAGSGGSARGCGQSRELPGELPPLSADPGAPGLGVLGSFSGSFIGGPWRGAGRSAAVPMGAGGRRQARRRRSLLGEQRGSERGAGHEGPPAGGERVKRAGGGGLHGRRVGVRRGR